MTPALSAVLVLSALTAQVSAECPDGWFHLGEACYLVSREAMTWYNGQGGYLAEILSAEEEDSLDQFLIKGVHYWIGLNDLSVEGKFRWDESHSVAEYTNWWPDQPNNTDGIEDCVFKSFVEGYRGWDDYYCDRKDWIDGGIHALCMMKYT